MNISFLFSVKSENFDFEPIFSFIKKTEGQNYSFSFFVEKHCGKAAKRIEKLGLNNVKVRIIENDQSDDNIFRYFIASAEKTSIVFCRSDIVLKSDKPLFEMIDEICKGNQIVSVSSVEKEKGKIRAFFSRVFSKIVKYIFGFAFPSSRTGLQFFSQSCVLVMQSNLFQSVRMSKTDSWKMIETARIASTDLTNSPPYISKSILKKIAFWSLFTVLFIIAYVLLACFVRSLNTAVFHFGMIFASCVLLIVVFYSIIQNIIFRKLGELLPPEEDIIFLGEKDERSK